MLAGSRRAHDEGRSRNPGCHVDNVDVGEFVEEPPGILRGGRAALELVEHFPLLLGGLGKELGDEYLPVGRVVPAPGQPCHLDAGFGQLQVLAGLRPFAPTPRESAEQHQVAHALGVAHGIGDRHGRTLGGPEQREPVESSGIHHYFEVFDPGFEREAGHLPVRQPASSLTGLRGAGDLHVVSMPPPRLNAPQAGQS